MIRNENENRVGEEMLIFTVNASLCPTGLLCRLRP